MGQPRPPRLVQGKAANVIPVENAISSSETDAVDRRSGGDQPRDLVLVDTAAGEDRRVGEAGAVEQPTYLPAERRQLARIEADAGEPVSARRQLADDLEGPARSRERVVGVDEQDRAQGRSG